MIDFILAVKFIGVYCPINASVRRAHSFVNSLFVSVYDNNFYLTTNISRVITLALLRQKTYPFSETSCSLNLLFHSIVIN
jgi:hypothetical protein